MFCVLIVVCVFDLVRFLFLFARRCFLYRSVLVCGC